MNNYDYIKVFANHTREEVIAFWSIRKDEIRELARQQGLAVYFADMIDLFFEMFPIPEAQKDIDSWYERLLKGSGVSDNVIEPSIRLFAEAFAAFKVDQDYLVRLKTDTDNEQRRLDDRIIESEMFLMRQTAKYFLDQGHKVFFEAPIVTHHWVEVGFGELYIDKEDKNEEIFWKFDFLNHLSDIDNPMFGAAKERHRKRLIEITKENIEEIKYKP